MFSGRRSSEREKREREAGMEGSSHAMTNERQPGDLISQVEMEHLNGGNSHPNNNEPTPAHSYWITEESIHRLRGLKDELFCIETDTTRDKLEKIMLPNNSHIPRVPPWMRDYKAYSKCFDPAVVSIGPYHHGNPKLLRIEELKIISARQFFTNCKSSMCDIYRKLEFLTSEAKNYYDDSIMANFDNEAFTVMMLLDGCFILDFMLQVGIGFGWMFMTLENDIPLISRDLFLLENQLPYPILEVLIDNENYRKRTLNRHINSEICKTNRMRLSPYADPNCFHILDLFGAKLVGDKPSFHCNLWPELSERSYPPVKELLATGITLKRKNSSCLCDVEFRTHLLSWELLLPQIEINHYTKDRFLNLIAYELSCRERVNRPFIAFICFLDTLIDHADDVKVLRSEGIICNYLGNDEEVANLVNQLATGLNPAPSAYSIVVQEIESHLQKKKRVYIGEFMHTYFHSPWTTIALIAAGYVILLTSIQTFFTIFPR